MATFYSNISSYYQLRLDISQASQDITNNTSSVYYKLTLTSGYSSFAKWGHIRWLIINGATVYSDTSQIAIGAQSSLVLAEGYTTVPHNNDGTKTVSFSASFDSGGSRPAYIVQTALVLSGSLALTTIPRASTISRTHASRTLGETQTFSISRASGSFTHTVRYRIGSGGWTNIATGVATSQSWTLPASLASSVTNNTKATITVECLTYNGGTHIGTSSTTFEMTIPNNSTYQPNVSINSGYPSIVDGLGGVAVQGKSKIRVVSSYSGNYGATIASVRATINGVNYSGQDVTSAVIPASGNIPVTVTVTDTRGYSKTTTTTYVNFIAYANPVITAFTAVRHPTNQDTGVLISVNFSISSVSNQNAKYYHIKYRPTGGSWTTVQSSSSVYSLNTTIPLDSGTADASLSYEFELEIRDSYNTVSNPIKRVVTFGTAFELINFNSSGKGIAFGKYSEKPEAIEIDLPVHITQGLNIYPQIYTPTFEGSWFDLGPDRHHAAKYWKDLYGVVHFVGVIAGGTSNSVCTLPYGFRPIGDLIVIGRSVSASTLDWGDYQTFKMRSNGELTYYNGGTRGRTVSLYFSFVSA